MQRYGDTGACIKTERYNLLDADKADLADFLIIYPLIPLNPRLKNVIL